MQSITPLWEPQILHVLMRFQCITLSLKQYISDTNLLNPNYLIFHYSQLERQTMHETNPKSWPQCNIADYLKKKLHLQNMTQSCNELNDAASLRWLGTILNYWASFLSNTTIYQLTHSYITVHNWVYWSYRVATCFGS
jgi:hypothetical protein